MNAKDWENLDGNEKNTIRQLAKTASENCRYCRGQGTVPVFSFRFDGNALRRDNNGNPYAACVMAHCQCEYGQWICERTPPEIQNQTPRVAEILAGSSPWYLTDPRDEVNYPPGRVAEADFEAFWCMVKRNAMLNPVDCDTPPKATVWLIEIDIRRRLVQKLGLDPRMAEVLTIEELRTIERVQGTDA